MEQTILKKDFLTKLICILFVGIILALTGCSSQEDTQLNGSASLQYYSFEEHLTRCTDIIIGEYKGKKEYSTETIYNFKIEERLLGEDVGNTLKVTSGPLYNTSLFYHNKDISYEKGERYLLILRRNRSVYLDEDKYTFVGRLFFPLNDLKNSSQYGESIANHSSKLSNPEQLTEDELVTYVKEMTAENTALFTGSDYIHSNDVKTITLNSANIFEVEVGEIYSYGFDDYVTRKCKVLSVLKGEISENIEVIIGFNEEMVKEGEKYIIALDATENETDIFILSSKNSVWKTSKRKKIEGYLK